MEIKSQQKLLYLKEEQIRNLTLELDTLKKTRVKELESKVIDRDLKIKQQRQQIHELEFLLRSFEGNLSVDD